MVDQSLENSAIRTLKGDLSLFAKYHLLNITSGAIERETKGAIEKLRNRSFLMQILHSLCKQIREELNYNQGSQAPKTRFQINVTVGASW